MELEIIYIQTKCNHRRADLLFIESNNFIAFSTLMLTNVGKIYSTTYYSLYIPNPNITLSIKCINLTIKYS